VQKLVSIEGLDAAYIEGSSMLDAYCRTLCPNLFSDNCVPEVAQFASFNESRWALQTILVSNSSISDIPSRPRRYLLTVTRLIKGRAFFVTQKGHIGLAPKAAKPNDQICVLLGCSTPLILRPIANEQHQIVGECYVHGLMNGEAFLGPLPSQSERITLDDSGLETDAYVNHPTEEVHVEDPRLGPLPEGWRFKSHSKEHLFSWIVNDKTGEEHDPRLTLQALKGRGVDLKVIKLI
jgi:hypothetical protein